MTVFLLVLFIFAISLLFVGIRGLFYKKEDLMDLKKEERKIIRDDKNHVDADLSYMMDLLSNNEGNETRNRKSNKK